MNRDLLEKSGRLTSGNAPLHERRKHMSNAMRDNVHMIRTMMANWPEEFQLPADHPVHEWLEVTDYICDQLETPDGKLGTSSNP